MGLHLSSLHWANSVSSKTCFNDCCVSFEYRWVYLLTRATITKCHWLDDLNSKFIFSQFWKPKIKMSAELVSPDTSLIGLQWLPSCCGYTWPFLSLCVSLVSLSLLRKTPVNIGLGSLWPHLTLINSLKVVSPHTAILEVIPATYKF